MGDLSRLMITGASGFIGRACVARARARGIDVCALYRRAPLSGWAGDDGIHPVQADLSDPAAANMLKEHLAGCQAVIHAAAHLGDDAAAHDSDTLRGTETLLATLKDSKARLVLVSSVAVYDMMQLAPGATCDEAAPLVDPQHPRDRYSAAKLRQEILCRAAGRPLWILRPGAVWGPGRSWNALMGFAVPKLFIRIGSDGELPLTHVDHAARALVEAATRTPEDTQVLNLLDDDRPTRARFVRAHRRMTGWPRLVLPIPYGLWLGIVRALSPFSARLPGLMREPIVRSRLLPLRWPNTVLRSTLGGEDIDTFEGMMARTVEAER